MLFFQQLNILFHISLATPLGLTQLLLSTHHHSISYSEFTRLTKSLASNLQHETKLSKRDVAFVLCSSSIKIPILYFSLLSLGVVISPANPVSTESEISCLINLCNPVIAFATSSTTHKLPKLKHKTILLDSPEFDSMMTNSSHELDTVKVSQSDIAAILYSSGTTGNVKGVILTRRNLIATLEGLISTVNDQFQIVSLKPVPYFHIYGFFYSLNSVALRETVVVMERFDLEKMLRAVEKFRVTSIGLAPPVVVEMVKTGLTHKYDLSSLQKVGCGGAPLRDYVIVAFHKKFPNVKLIQAYGMTESAGAVFREKDGEESKQWGSVGRLIGSCETKIVNPETWEALFPGEQGELWVKGPMTMKGYVGDPESTSASLVSDGWMRTGDVCYFDEDGFLFVVDWLKELIKYKGYQVAPAELEQLLCSHPELMDAAVIPFADEVAGQVPMAFVVKRPHSSLNEREVMDFVAKLVSPYKKIRQVAFISSIPKSAAGKILRKGLRKMIFPGPTSRM